METGNFSDEDIEKAKITFQNTCKEILDSPYDIINTYVSQEYLQTDLLEERMKQINKVDRDMVIKFSKKVHLDTIYLLEGSSLNAEKNIQSRSRTYYDKLNGMEIYVVLNNVNNIYVAFQLSMVLFIILLFHLEKVN